MQTIMDRNTTYIIVTWLILFLMPRLDYAQCVHDEVYSERRTQYVMEVELDTASKSALTKAHLTYVNSSPDTLKELRFYMYLNAFKHTETTFLKGAGDDIFGQSIADLKEEEWGYVEMTSIIEEGGRERIDQSRYVQPNDENKKDESVLAYILDQPLLPGDTLVMNYSFVAKLPKLLVRSGYSRDHFYHFTHWFPQVGVYQKEGDNWQWNCHQFHRRTEFYADFGSYDVTISGPEELVIAGTGCKENLPAPQGIQKVRFIAEDVIDFAWVAYPGFTVVEDQWNGVEITMVVAEEHANLMPRFLEVLKFSLRYMEENVGPYYYPSITAMDPPMHALRSGFMEYPQYITLGSFRYFPKEVRSVESLVVHEFVHQYFMATLASNEKEEAWLDEGFVTYYEDRIMEELYGQASSLIDFGFFTVSNSALSRDEYTSLPDPAVVSQARPGWEIPESYKGLVYSKTATVLKSFEQLVGRADFDAIIRDYYDQWKFDHPRSSSFFDVAEAHLEQRYDSVQARVLMRFIQDGILTNKICDFAVSSIMDISNIPFNGLEGSRDDRNYIQETSSSRGSEVTLRRKGDWVTPVEVRFVFKNGTTRDTIWDGAQRIQRYRFEDPVQTCVIDPERKLYVDIDLTNNALSKDENTRPLWVASSQLSAWIQNILQSLTFLI